MRKPKNPDSLIQSWISQLDRRKTLFPELFASAEQALRLVDDKENTGYACDKLGDRLWFYRFRESEMDAEEQQAIKLFTEATRLTKSVIRQMTNRGEAPAISSDEEVVWTACEGAAKFQLAQGRGWSPGLFLDQRGNRQWVRENATGKKLLNLFCYTGGFSINAALGGATEVVSVDTSTQTLQWCKENFRLNDLQIADYEFWPADARAFLQACKRKQRKFDLIICDPPSFARNKHQVFKIDKDGAELVISCLDCLDHHGKLLFSCNYEKWSRQDLLEQATAWASTYHPASVQLLPRSLDYAETAPMKSVLISLD